MKYESRNLEEIQISDNGQSSYIDWKSHRKTWLKGASPCTTPRSSQSSSLVWSWHTQNYTMVVTPLLSFSITKDSISYLALSLSKEKSPDIQRMYTGGMAALKNNVRRIKNTEL